MLKRSKVKKEEERKKIKEGDGEVNNFMGYVPTEEKLPHLNGVEEESGDITADDHITDPPKTGGKDYLADNEGINEVAKSLLVGVIFEVEVMFEESIPEEKDND